MMDICVYIYTCVRTCMAQTSSVVQLTIVFCSISAPLEWCVWFRVRLRACALVTCWCLDNWHVAPWGAASERASEAMAGQT